MGIVVTVVMFIGIVVMGQKIVADKADVIRQTVAQRVAAVALLVLGFWNAVWYGLQHIGELWGYAALVSGVVMVASAAWVLSYLHAKWLGKFLLAILIACFLLYAVTLVQLNLGYPILQ